MWELFDPQIYRYVKNNKIWFDPTTGEKLSRCPFLEIEPTKSDNKQSASPLKYTCSIYLSRPEDCRHYPTSIAEMVNDECEMIEPSDLLDYPKAQKKLDIIMIMSRPPNAG